jgi:hypothetical protein
VSDESPLIPTDKLVKIYIKMRDKRSEIKAAFEQEDAAIKAQMEVVESKLLETCKVAGANSINTGVGTVIRSVQTRYWTSDWESMHQFIMENQAPELLERRISQTTMKEFITNHPDKLPKGLNADSKYVITVRRK